MTFEIRKDRRPQGRKILVREREEYFRLMDQGVSNREACRIVGIDRRSGMRWRNGWRPSGRHRGSAPVKRPGTSEGPSRYLREADRIHIADRLREKASVRKIAGELGRSPSTVSREIRRNGTAGRGGRWHYLQAARGQAGTARGPQRRQCRRPHSRGRPRATHRDNFTSNLLAPQAASQHY
ncbi:helix-turn-helix domain-containing protein [Streptomyces sp. WAC 01325]|uniref:helix-turn-helix domain-containing protein n=1 Tax=Streptomyces sp. WAC 01325 TaxID=2203202 RepID=UPI0026BAA35C